MKAPVDLQSLSNLTSKVWQDYELTVKVAKVLRVASASSERDYDLVLVADSTGYRIFYNCANLVLKEGQIYHVKVRASQDKRSNKITCFMTQASVVYGATGSFEGSLDLAKKAHSMVASKLYLTVTRITKLENFLELEESTQKSSYNLSLKDSENNIFYYRIWPEDSLEASNLEEGTVMVFEYPTVTKRDEAAGVNLSKNKFTVITLEDILL